MASKRILTGQSMSSIQSNLPLGLSAALREEKKTTRSTSVHQLNEISITLQGQQTVQEIVNKATQLFQCLQETSMVVDEKSEPFGSIVSLLFIQWWKNDVSHGHLSDR